MQLPLGKMGLHAGVVGISSGSFLLNLQLLTSARMPTKARRKTEEKAMKAGRAYSARRSSRLCVGSCTTPK